MTIFTGETAEGRYRSKFIRVNDTISVSNPNDTEIFHAELLLQDELFEEFTDTLEHIPTEVDGGFVQFDTNRQRVIVNGVSTGLDIPRYTEGRQKTIKRFQDILPDYEVKNLMPAGLRTKER